MHNLHILPYTRMKSETRWCTKKHYCSRNLWGTYGEHMENIWGARAIPICSPYVRHMGKISKTTKSYVAHMLSNIWGNLWATQQHMGNIWGNVVIFAFKLALLNIWGTYGKHMGNIWGNIWETYGEHMGNIWGAHPKQHPTKPFPSPADAAPSRTVRLPQSLFW